MMINDTANIKESAIVGVFDVTGKEHKSVQDSTSTRNPGDHPADTNPSS